MEEKQIICGKQKLSIIGIIIIAIGIFILYSAFSCSILKGVFCHDTCFGYKPYMWAIVLGFILLVFGIVFTISTSCCKIYVTDKRVYGKAIFGKRVDIPIDSVSAVGTIPLFRGIAISSASGAIKFLYISNSNEIHAEISKLIIARQDKNISDPEKIEMSQSSADELKKFKDLYDSGVISEEEYEAKKKQLLGL